MKILIQPGYFTGTRLYIGSLASYDLPKAHYSVNGNGRNIMINKPVEWWITDKSSMGCYSSFTKYLSAK